MTTKLPATSPALSRVSYKRVNHNRWSRPAHQETSRAWLLRGTLETHLLSLFPIKMLNRAPVHLFMGSQRLLLSESCSNDHPQGSQGGGSAVFSTRMNVPCSSLFSPGSKSGPLLLSSLSLGNSVSVTAKSTSGTTTGSARRRARPPAQTEGGCLGLRQIVPACLTNHDAFYSCAPR